VSPPPVLAGSAGSTNDFRNQGHRVLGMLPGVPMNCGPTAGFFTSAQSDGVRMPIENSAVLDVAEVMALVMLVVASVELCVTTVTVQR
jgi:hypothetical protein